MPNPDAGTPTATSDDGIRIRHYDDWMLPQVIDLFVAEYASDREEEKRAFLEFYEHPFQRAHGIRLVALDSERVCGFQSFFYWPYMYRGRELRTFQSGRSLISPDYRGRRIFARLLNFLAESEDRPEIDCLMGFPVEMSYGSFMRNRWSNPLDLVWYARILHPFSVIRPGAPSDADFDFQRKPEAVEPYYPHGGFSLAKNPEFVAWRNAYAATRSYYYFHHREGEKMVRFELKPNQRGRINELVIGDIVGDWGDPELLRRGLRALVRSAKRHSFLTILTIAINTRFADSSLLASLRRLGFIRLRSKIYFIVKPIVEMPEFEDPRCWWLLRSDIDTW
jgi:GNAT superfamily N-acetyltransferase